MLVSRKLRLKSDSLVGNGVLSGVVFSGLRLFCFVGETSLSPLSRFPCDGKVGTRNWGSVGAVLGTGRMHFGWVHGWMACIRPRNRTQGSRWKYQYDC